MPLYSPPDGTVTERNSYEQSFARRKQWIVDCFNAVHRRKQPMTLLSIYTHMMETYAAFRFDQNIVNMLLREPIMLQRMTPPPPAAEPVTPQRASPVPGPISSPSPGQAPVSSPENAPGSSPQPTQPIREEPMQILQPAPGMLAPQQPAVASSPPALSFLSSPPPAPPQAPEPPRSPPAAMPETAMPPAIEAAPLPISMSAPASLSEPSAVATFELQPTPPRGPASPPPIALQEETELPTEPLDFDDIVSQLPTMPEFEEHPPSPQQPQEGMYPLYGSPHIREMPPLYEVPPGTAGQPAGGILGPSSSVPPSESFEQGAPQEGFGLPQEMPSGGAGAGDVPGGAGSAAGRQPEIPPEGNPNVSPGGPPGGGGGGSLPGEPPPGGPGGGGGPGGLPPPPPPGPPGGGPMGPGVPLGPLMPGLPAQYPPPQGVYGTTARNTTWHYPHDRLDSKAHQRKHDSTAMTVLDTQCYGDRPDYQVSKAPDVCYGGFWKVQPTAANAPTASFDLRLLVVPAIHYFPANVVFQRPDKDYNPYLMQPWHIQVLLQLARARTRFGSGANMVTRYSTRALTRHFLPFSHYLSRKVPDEEPRKPGLDEFKEKDPGRYKPNIKTDETLLLDPSKTALLDVNMMTNMFGSTGRLRDIHAHTGHEHEINRLVSAINYVRDMMALSYTDFTPVDTPVDEGTLQYHFSTTNTPASSILPPDRVDHPRFPITRVADYMYPSASVLANAFVHEIIGTPPPPQGPAESAYVNMLFHPKDVFSDAVVGHGNYYVNHPFFSLSGTEETPLTEREPIPNPVYIRPYLRARTLKRVDSDEDDAFEGVEDRARHYSQVQRGIGFLNTAINHFKSASLIYMANMCTFARIAYIAMARDVSDYVQMTEPMQKDFLMGKLRYAIPFDCASASTFSLFEQWSHALVINDYEHALLSIVAFANLGRYLGFPFRIDSTFVVRSFDTLVQDSDLRTTHLPFYVFMTELLLQYHMNNKTRGSRRTTNLQEIVHAPIHERRALFARRMDDMMLLLIRQRHLFLHKRARDIYEGSAAMEARGPAHEQLVIVRQWNDIPKIDVLVDRMQTYKATLAKFETDLDTILNNLAMYSGDGAFVIQERMPTLAKQLKGLSSGVYLVFPWKRLFDIIPFSYTAVEDVWFEILTTICFICKRLSVFNGPYFRWQYVFSAPKVHMSVHRTFFMTLFNFHGFVRTVVLPDLVKILALMTHVEMANPVPHMSLSELQHDGSGYTSLLDNTSFLTTGQPYPLSYYLIMMAMRTDEHMNVTNRFDMGIDRQRFTSWLNEQRTQGHIRVPVLPNEIMKDDTSILIDGKPDSGGLLAEDEDE